MVDPHTPPNFTGTYPLGGELIGPAWRTAWAVLAGDPTRWHISDALAAAMTADGGIVDKTARGLLAAARRHRVLEVRYVRVGKPRRRRASYRIA